MIYLDTHVLVWLYAGRWDLVPQTTRDVLNTHDLKISPMVRLELQYLYEIDRLSTPASVVFDELAGVIGISVCTESFSSILIEAEKHAWAQDPFDRIIVAQSAYSSSPLLTKDESIQKHYVHAIWDRVMAS